MRLPEIPFQRPDDPESLARFLRGALVSAAGAATGVLFVWQILALASWPEYVSANVLPLPARVMMLVASLSTGMVFGIAAMIWAMVGARTPAHASERIARLGCLLAPLLVLPLLPPLLSRGPWEGRELMFLVALGLCSLVLERLLRVSFAALPPSIERGQRRLRALLGSRSAAVLSILIVLGAGCYYFYYIGQLTVAAHHKMLTASSDLAEFDNLFFNALHGHPFRSPAIEGDLENWSALKVHAEFGLYLLLPFYALRPGPEALLWIQTGVIALGAIPVYLLSSRRLGRLAGIIFALAFLCLPVVQRPNFYDFHFSPFGMLLVLWTLYFLDGLLLTPVSTPRWTRRRQQLAFAGFFALALLSREDVSLGLVVVGLFVALGAARVRLGATIAVVSLAYFVVVKFVVMPRFGQMWFDTIYQDLKAPGGKGFGAVALTLLSNPAYVLRSLLIEPKFLYLLHMTVPVLCLWLRRPALWLAAAPGFVSTLLVTNRAPMFESSFQYAFLWVPYILMASVLSLSTTNGERAVAVKRRAAVIALGFAAVASCTQLGILLGGERIRGGFGDKSFQLSEADQKRRKDLLEMVAKIPREASVAATEAVGPHVSTRLVMYSLKFTLGREPDYLLVEAPRMRSEVEHVRQAFRSGDYGVIEHQGSFWLLQRGGERKLNRRFRRALRF